VLLDVISDDLSVHSIVLDKFDAARAAANALIEQGHTLSSFINNASGIPHLSQNVRV
jgi:DNA-binding LacI/PurR family transcriptional regulator